MKMEKMRGKYSNGDYFYSYTFLNKCEQKIATHHESREQFIDDVTKS